MAFYTPGALHSCGSTLLGSTLLGVYPPGGLHYLAPAISDLDIRSPGDLQSWASTFLGV